jgi:hypothetical protein
MRNDGAVARVTAVMVLTLLSGGLMACGGSDGGDVRTVTVGAAATSVQAPAATAPPVRGDAILIETRITDARAHAGKVLAASVFGESPFCRGGTSSGGSDGPTITTTFACPEGTLSVRYAPTQPSLVQGSVWEVVSGTGSFEGLRGGGSMVAKFQSDDPDTGREIFTGTLGK